MTILELLLDHLPERYVDAIVNNVYDNKVLYRKADSIEIEMLILFDWNQSREGYDFWEEVLECVISGDELPPLPIDITYKPGTIILTKDQMYLMNSFNTGINVSFDIDYSMIHTMDTDKKEKIYSLVN
jgi:hypothetical protein